MSDTKWVITANKQVKCKKGNKYAPVSECLKNQDPKCMVKCTKTKALGKNKRGKAVSFKRQQGKWPQYYAKYYAAEHAVHPTKVATQIMKEAAVEWNKIKQKSKSRSPSPMRTRARK